MSADNASFSRSVSDAASGGAIASGISGPGVTVTASAFTSTSAATDGGAVSSGVAASISGSRFSNVTSVTGRGGAVWSRVVSLTQCQVADARSTKEVRTLCS